MAYEFVEAFSSVFPRIRVSQILALVGIILDLIWRIMTRNFLNPSFIDILAALTVGFYLGKRPALKSEQAKKSKWIRLS
jgi:hypothetical protein